MVGCWRGRSPEVRLHLERHQGRTEGEALAAALWDTLSEMRVRLLCYLSPGCSALEVKLVHC